MMLALQHTIIKLLWYQLCLLYVLCDECYCLCRLP